MNKFELSVLPYPIDALEPVISKTTIEFHHGKHEQTYLNNLNNLIAGTPYEHLDLCRIVKESDGPIFNNASQAWNHAFYFQSFVPGPEKRPQDELLKKIEKAFGSFESFKKTFSESGASIFGSGWVWLAQNHEKELLILKESNAGNPMTKGYTPLLCFDVWEHAYYLDYQNRRLDHLDSLFKIVNWEKVAQRMK